jgi:hypothetical protein
MSVIPHTFTSDVKINLSLAEKLSINFPVTDSIWILPGPDSIDPLASRNEIKELEDIRKLGVQPSQFRLVEQNPDLFKSIKAKYKPLGYHVYRGWMHKVLSSDLTPISYIHADLMCKLGTPKPVTDSVSAVRRTLQQVVRRTSKDGCNIRVTTTQCRSRGRNASTVYAWNQSVAYLKHLLENLQLPATMRNDFAAWISTQSGWEPSVTYCFSVLIEESLRHNETVPLLTPVLYEEYGGVGGTPLETVWFHLHHAQQSEKKEALEHSIKSLLKLTI